jgi:hypothetical protein
MSADGHTYMTKVRVHYSKVWMTLFYTESGEHGTDVTTYNYLNTGTSEVFKQDLDQRS